jgi:hypothetical protein
MLVAVLLDNLMSYDEALGIHVCAVIFSFVLYSLTQKLLSLTLLG